MLREIKFRAWNFPTRQMHYWGTIQQLNRTDSRNIEAEHNHFLQFTGLKDKNSVEIYEGDIVRFQPVAKPAEIYEVIWEHFGFAYKKPGEAGVSTYLQQSYVEVIGNRFENPELLKI